MPTKNAVRDKIEAVIAAAAAAYQPIGSYQPLDSDLTAIAALSTTSFGRAFLALADAAATRTAIGLVLGTDIYSKSAIDSGFQPLDSDLTAFAALAPSNDDVAQRKAGAWTNRAMAQLLTDLGIAASYQPLDSDLTAIAALSTTSFGRSVLAAANAAALATLAGVGTGDSPTMTALTLSNGQIAFPASQVASAGANTLDDYEEGTWTPAVTFTTPGNSSFSYGSQVGTYTKIGRFVHGRISMVFTPTVGTGSGNFLISVPFTAAVAGGPDGQVTFLSSQFSWPASRTTVALDLVDTTHFVVIANGTAAAGTNFAASNLTSAAAHTIQAGFAYYV